MAKIGIFDSGIGGLSVLNEALLQAPGHDFIYLADSLHAPYGEKSSEWVAHRSLILCTWLIEQACDAIVVACNTATASAIAQIRTTFPGTPVVGVEPGVKPAAEASQKKIVGVLATQNTLQSEKFKQLLSHLGSNCTVLSQAGKGLVPLIESGVLTGPKINALLRTYIEPMLENGADTLVLGCTHYPFLQDTIKSLFGERLEIIDTSHAIVKQLVRLIPPQSKTQGSVVFYSTKNGIQLLELANKLLPVNYLRGAGSHTMTL